MLAIHYFLGPTLFRVYRNLERSERYVGNSFERYGTNIIFCMTLAYNMGYYIVPPWVSYQVLTRRGDFFQLNNLAQGFKYLSGIGIVYLFAITLRAIGRASNPVYKEYLQVLSKAIKEPTQANKAKLQFYDAEFSAWPVDFSVKDGKPLGRRVQIEPPNRGCSFQNFTSIPNRFLAWLMTHTFGLKLVYPGSIKMLQATLAEPLEEGRAKWVLEKRGKRFKLQTQDNNEIDSMFFDRRDSSNPNGKTLVVTCEGNAGFYEIGFLGSPMDAGFSVIGWNHPGFGGSSGSPFPDQEVNAMDAVVQFALQVLKFDMDQIVFHGWSIGGFPASWAAMNYPDAKAVILDATFDSLLPLATSRMPTSLEPLVRIAIEEHMNLNIIEHMKKYHGPIRLIRRSHDEIITVTSGQRGTNRGNNLLLQLLEFRYPQILGEDQQQLINEYLMHDDAGQGDMLIRQGVLESEMSDLIQSHSDDNLTNRHFPSTLGQDLNEELKNKLALYLASRYLIDFDSTHCAPLPAHLFLLPWEHPTAGHNDFVKI